MKTVAVAALNRRWENLYFSATKTSSSCAVMAMNFQKNGCLDHDHPGLNPWSPGTPGSRWSARHSTRGEDRMIRVGACPTRVRTNMNVTMVADTY